MEQWDQKISIGFLFARDDVPLRLGPAPMMLATTSDDLPKEGRERDKSGSSFGESESLGDLEICCHLLIDLLEFDD